MRIGMQETGSNDRRRGARGAVGRKGLWTLGLLLGALALTGAPTGAVPAPGEATPAPPAAASAEAVRPEAYPPAVRDEVVGTIRGRKITRAMLFSYNLSYKQGGMPGADVFTKPPASLAPLLKDMALTRIAAEYAGRPGSGVDAETLGKADESAAKVVIQALYEAEILNKTPAATQEEIAAFYRDNSEAFHTPFTFSIRHVFVSTYQNVKTEADDTLEGLAERIAGSKDKVDQILIDNDAKAPRAPRYSKGNREGLKPLEPGELLLVPMSEEGKQEKRAKIDRAYARLEAGDDFTSVALEFSENATKGQEIAGLRQAGRPMLPELLRAVEETPPGRYCPVFETKHGFNIVQVTAKTPATSQTLEEAAVRIRETLAVDKRNQRTIQYVEDLFQIPELKIDAKALRDPATSESAPVVVLGQSRYPKSLFLMKELGDTTPEVSDADIQRILRSSQQLKRDLLLFRANQIGLDKSDEVYARLDGGPNKELREAWLKVVAARIEKQKMPPAEAKRYFDAHQADFRLAGTYSFYLVAMQVPGATKDSKNIGPDSKEVNEVRIQIARELVGVDTLDAFKKVAARFADKTEGMQPNGLLEDIPEGRIGANLKAELEKLQPGSMGRPVYEAPHVLVPWLVKRTPSRVPEFDEIKDELPDMVQRVQQQTFPRDEVDRLLEEARVEVR